MPGPTPLLRRALGATLAAAVSVGGLTIAAAPAAHAEPTGSCTASFDKEIVRPGQTAVLTAVAPGSPHYVEKLTVDGHVVPDNGWSDWVNSTVGPLDYAWWSNWADGGETVGFRFYTPETMGSEVDDSTPYECGAEVTLGPALTAQTIDFPAMADHPLTDGIFAATASSDSGLLVTLTSETPDVCQINGTNTVQLKDKGLCTIAATQAGDEEHAAAAEVDRSFWVQVPQSIDFPRVDATPLTAGHVVLSAVADSGRFVTYTTDTPDVCTITPPPPPPAAPNKRTGLEIPGSAQVDLIDKGLCRVIAHQSGGGEYLPADDAEQWFWVQVPQTLSLSEIPDTLLSAGTVQLDASATSGDWISYTVADPSVCDVPMVAGAPNTGRDHVVASTVPQTTLTLKKVGTCTVTAFQPGGGAYLPSNEVTRSFKVYEKEVAPPTDTKPATPAPVKLQVPAGVALSKGSAAFSATPNASVTSGTPSVCTVASANRVRLARAGTCTLTAAHAGAASVTRSFPVWGAPTIPAKGKTTQTIPVLGKGESGLRVKAKPAAVCRATGGDVVLVAPGACTVRVKDHGAKVRGGKIDVAFVKSAKPAEQLKHGGRVRFAFNSAVLTQTAKKALHHDLRTLRKAHTVIVYGNTFGPGKNSAHSRKLAANRAAAVVRYLKAHGVEAKAVTIAAAMENPVSKDPAKNRRADIYYLR